jgi:hypothetical protein
MRALSDKRPPIEDEQPAVADKLAVEGELPEGRLGEQRVELVERQRAVHFPPPLARSPCLRKQDTSLVVPAGHPALGRTFRTGT